MSCAMPMTSSSANAVKTSRRSVLRDDAQHRPRQVAADHDHADDRADDLERRRASRGRRRVRRRGASSGRARSAGSPRCPGRAGSRTRSRPSGVSSRLRSLIVCTRDRGRREREREPGDERRLPRQPSAQQHRRPSAAPHASSCSEPPPNTPRRMLPQALRIELEPDDEQHQHHAELGEVQDRLDVAHEPEAERADHAAGDEIAEHRAEAEAAWRSARRSPPRPR